MPFFKGVMRKDEILSCKQLNKKQFRRSEKTTAFFPDNKKNT
jgi:hypothetical protein